ncbi:MAG: single-stranded-DNA-specific exonuclease RecJ [Clostridia bacterium]|nr:single-stranded-DNA-specific exonuclease RecJ [Clostridia bacterium]
MREIKREKIWEQRYVFGDVQKDAAIREVSEALGVSPLFSVLLYNRGYTTAESARHFLRFEETDFHDPYLMADMERAVDRILSAVDKKEKIYIYGDYDVDGVTSVSMLYLYLTSLGAEVGIKIPKRDGEGYGVSGAAVRTIAESGATLIITVDTGITANAEVEYARELGVDFVVTDHHECHGELPLAAAVVNPHRPDCEYPFKELAGVGVIFKTICACEMKREEMRGGTAIDGVRRISSDYADLVAVGTIADVMPLVDENRLIVSLGLSKLEKGQGRPGLIALLDASTKKNGDDTKRKKVTSGMIGFGIAPRINAAGRMSDALIAVRLLLASDPFEVAERTEELCEINRQRQVEENQISTEANRILETNRAFDNDKVIILDSDEWQQGIIGIVASRITEKYGLPSILVSFSGSIIGEPSPYDDGKGSGRSIKGLNLVEALTYCEDLLEKYGGHELAAGLTVKRGKIDAFRKRINEYARERITDDMLKISVEADCELEANEINMELANEILRLEPFGIGNASPQFILKNAYVKKITYIGGGKHSKLLLEKDGVIHTAMYFGVGEGELSCTEGDTVDVLFNIDINDYKNLRSVQLIIHDIHVVDSLKDRYSKYRARYEEIRSGGSYLFEEQIVPAREDFAKVYTALRREFRAGVSVLESDAILKMVNTASAEEINYIKLKFILEILNELQICEVEELDTDIYRFNIFFNAKKTNIEKSSILKKIKGQCENPQYP